MKQVSEKSGIHEEIVTEERHMSTRGGLAVTFVFVLTLLYGAVMGVKPNHNNDVLWRVFPCILGFVKTGNFYPLL